MRKYDLSKIYVWEANEEAWRNLYCIKETNRKEPAFSTPFLARQQIHIKITFKNENEIQESPDI